jgi:hypothetical protein
MRQKDIQEIKEGRRLRARMAKVQRRKNYHSTFPLSASLNNPCAICGIREATTRDHVPPKCIFPEPRPNPLITVPACSQCNNGASDDDDKFKVYLSLHTAGNNDIATKLFHEKTKRTLDRNQALLNKIREESQEVEIDSKNGGKEKRTAIKWDSRVHDAIIERTIRGLYFHHTGNVLPKGAKLSVQWLKEVPIDPRLSELLQRCETVSIGDDQVIYKFAIYPDNPKHSIWFFDFYGAHWASGYTSPA